MPDSTPDNPEAATAAKSRLRRLLRAERRALPADRAHGAGQAIAGHLSAMPGWPEARCIALYLPADGEIDTLPAAEACRASGKQICLPIVLDGGGLAFAPWRSGDSLTRNRFGIGEPPASAGRVGLSDLDVLLLPVVGWDREGTRLGMGGGFYDRCLATADAVPLLVGLAYAQQRVDKLPRESWDIAMDFVITENGLYRCGSGDLDNGRSPSS
jgi:5-formyltetrahydrofolate cyclo-ligase